MSDAKEFPLEAVSERTRRAREIQTRWGWVEPTVWTERNHRYRPADQASVRNRDDVESEGIQVESPFLHVTMISCEAHSSRRSPLPGASSHTIRALRQDVHNTGTLHGKWAMGMSHGGLQCGFESARLWLSR